jgi:hypothetical protein
VRLESFNLKTEAISMISRYSLVAFALLALVACTRTPETSANGHDQVTVFKNESCGCCKLWVRHLQNAGFAVEGHAPAEDIKRLLRERPDAKGLTVPGMPAGSPGMEVPSGQSQPYDVYLVSKDGTTSVYAHHGG